MLSYSNYLYVLSFFILICLYINISHKNDLQVEKCKLSFVIIGKLHILDYFSFYITIAFDSFI